MTFDLRENPSYANVSETHYSRNSGKDFTYGRSMMVWSHRLVVNKNVKIQVEFYENAQVVRNVQRDIKIRQSHKQIVSRTFPNIRRLINTKQIIANRALQA